MPYNKKSFIEHTAIFVKDISRYIYFFESVLGMTVDKAEKSDGEIKQAWTTGGLQLISSPDLKTGEGNLAHLGIVTEDLEQTLEKIYSFDGVTQAHGKERNWVRLPDGLELELIQQK